MVRLFANSCMNKKKSQQARFFKHKEGTLSFSHMRKMLKACQRAVILIQESKEFQVTEATRERTMKSLKSLSSEYFLFIYLFID